MPMRELPDAANGRSYTCSRRVSASTAGGACGCIHLPYAQCREVVVPSRVSHVQVFVTRRKFEQAGAVASSCRKKARALSILRAKRHVEAGVRGGAEGLVHDALHIVHVTLIKVELAQELKVNNGVVRLACGGVAVGQALQLLQNERHRHPVRVLRAVCNLRAHPFLVRVQECVGQVVVGRAVRVANHLRPSRLREKTFAQARSISCKRVVALRRRHVQRVPSNVEKGGVVRGLGVHGALGGSGLRRPHCPAVLVQAAECSGECGGGWRKDDEAGNGEGRKRGHDAAMTIFHMLPSHLFALKRLRHRCCPRAALATPALHPPSQHTRAPHTPRATTLAFHKHTTFTFRFWQLLVQ